MDAVNRSAAPKFGTIGVATSKKMAIVGARINEKLAHLGADLRHSLFCALHPSVLRLAAKESNIAIKSVATVRRRQEEAKAREVANKKRALVRQQRHAWHSQQRLTASEAPARSIVPFRGTYGPV